MSKVKGKRPTIAQYKILKRNGYKDNLEDWRYMGIKYTNINGDAPSRNDVKIVNYHFINKETNESIYIKEK